MVDTTITKIDSSHSPKGEAGQKYLASGKTMSMRLWECEPENAEKPESQRDYETVGYVIKGKAELHIEGQMVLLTPGDSWTVPKGSSHRYKILEAFTAVESTSPPAEVHGRDEGMSNNKEECNGKQKNGKHESSENNSVAEFAKATSVEECAPGKPGLEGGKGAVDKTTEVSPMDKGAEDEIDGENPPKEGETDAAKAKAAPVKPDAMPAGAGEATKEDVKKLNNADESSTEKAAAVDEAKQVKEDTAANKAKEAEGQPEAPAKKADPDAKLGAEEDTGPGSEDDAKAVQEIAGEIPRPDSEVTSNSPEKAPEPAEHIDLGKST